MPVMTNPPLTRHTYFGNTTMLRILSLSTVLLFAGCTTSGPSGSNSNARSVHKDVLIVNLSKEGLITIDNKVVTMKELPDVVKKRGAKKAIVRAASGVSLRRGLGGGYRE